MSVIHQFEKILSDSRAVYEKAAGGDRDHGQTGAGKFFVTEETGPGTGRDANILHWEITWILWLISLIQVKWRAR